MAWVMAVWTSVAAAAMLVQRELEGQLDVPLGVWDVTTSSPVICMNWRSSGVAMFVGHRVGARPG